MKPEFIRFALAGAAATLTTYAVLILGVEVFALSATLSSATGYALGIVVNYLLNYRYTFRTDQRHSTVFPRFLIVMCVGMLANAAIMFTCHELAGLHYLVAQLVAVSVVLFWSFSANSLWAFARRSATTARGSARWKRPPTN